MEQLYTLNEIAEKLKVSRLTLSRWEKKGQLKVIRVNGHPRVTESEFKRLLKGE